MSVATGVVQVIMRVSMITWAMGMTVAPAGFLRMSTRAPI